MKNNFHVNTYGIPCIKGWPRKNAYFYFSGLCSKSVKFLVHPLFTFDYYFLHYHHHLFVQHNNSNKLEITVRCQMFMKIPFLWLVIITLFMTDFHSRNTPYFFFLRAINSTCPWPRDVYFYINKSISRKCTWTLMDHITFVDGHHVNANYAPNQEFCSFPPFLIVVLQHRHQIQNLCKILIYLKKKDDQMQTVFIVFTAL